MAGGQLGGVEGDASATQQEPVWRSWLRSSGGDISGILDP